MNLDADAIVVGAGPAGSAAAFFLAQLDRHVLLLDRAHFPREKACGDGLTRSAVRVLEEMGVQDRFPGAPHIGGVRVHMRGKGAREFRYPTGGVTPDHGLVVPRYLLDRVLCERAVEVGAKLQESTCVTGLLREGDRIVGVEALHDGTAVCYHAPVVIGADGAASRVARLAGLAGDRATGFGFALRCYCSDVEGLGDLLEIHLPLTDPTDRYLLPSYGWVFPVGATAANVGVGVFERTHDVNLRAMMSRFLLELRKGDDRFRRMKEETRWRGAPLSFGFQPERCTAPGLVLVGDAAGMTSPFTGEGISYALESGKLAAEVIHRNLRGDNAPDLAEYQAVLERRYLGYFEAGRHSARRYLLVWHVLASTFHNDLPLYALCRKAALFPEEASDANLAGLLGDVGALVEDGALRVREDLLGVGEVLLASIRKDWPVLGHFSVGGHGDPGVPFRPALLLLLSGACGDGADPRLVPAAAAIELGYLAALAHLSVEEDDPGRPGQEPSSANWGNMVAVIGGDFLLSKGYDLSARIGTSVSEAIAVSLGEVSRARVRRMRIAQDAESVSDEDYPAVLGREVALLFELPCRIGAVLGGLSAAGAEALAAYGRELGLAYYLSDEVLALQGRESELGKAVVERPGAGLRTLPIRLALQSPRRADVEAVLARASLASGSSGEELAAVVEESGAALRCRRLAREHATASIRMLEAIAPGPARRTLARLADYAVTREGGRRRDLRAELKGNLTAD